jgi:photosystem II stability/assembly factor-like uncharacterized protein
MVGVDRKSHGLRYGFLFLLALIAFGVAARAQQLQKDTLHGMKYRLVGPFLGGRVESVAGVSGTHIFYFGAVGGGVWKTTNDGQGWEPIFDKEPISSIGALAVAPSDPNVIYVGTGEPDLRGDISYGDGVYKSTDAGKTWTHIGLTDTRHIAKIIVDPHNPNLVMVAAIGHAFGPNAERGVFRSTDGGKTWQKVLYKNENTGAVDLVFDPKNPHIVYAALYQVRRQPWTFTSGGPGSGIYKSTDEGLTWKHLTGHGLPKGVLGKIGLAVAANGERVYALIEAKKGGLYVSNNAGESWHYVNGDHRFRQRAWYFTKVYADPKNVNTLYILNVSFFRSTDGGHLWSQIHPPHGDCHALWIDPNNPKRMILGDDGGATVSINWGKTWSTESNQPTGQFYHIATDNRFPYYLYGSQQDRSSIAIASRTPHGYIGRQDWYHVGPNESGYVVPDPANPDIVYSDSYFGILTRFNKKTGQSFLISPWPDDPDGWPAADQKYRFTWTMPIAIAPWNPDELFFAGQVLFQSMNGGQSWKVISPDLTRNDKAKQGPSGGPITKDQASAEYYDVIYTIAPSPHQKGTIWVGTDDGLVWLTRDDGAHWENVTPRDLPAWSKVSMITLSPEAAGTAFVAVNRFKNDDLRPYIWKTTDYGKTWTSITNGIPVGAFVHVVREDPKRPGLLFAGTELGVYVSFNDGAEWQPLKLNLPTVSVRDLVIHDNDLDIATHGRAFWILDDITPLRQMTAATLDQPVHLFTPAPAVRFRGPSYGFYARSHAVGQNAPDGVIIDYYLKTKPQGLVSLDILNAKGKVIRSFTSKPRKIPNCHPDSPRLENEAPGLPDQPGLNRFVWDMRFELPVAVTCAVYDEGGPLAPLALSGHYEARLTIEGKSYTAPIEIIPDPRVKATAEDLAQQFDLMTKLNDLMQQDHVAVLEIRDVQKQLDALKERLSGNPKAKDIVAAAEHVRQQITAVEDSLIQSKATASEDMLNYPIELNSKLGYLINGVDSGDSAPPTQDWQLYQVYEKRLDGLVAQWKNIQATSLAQLNRKIRSENIPAVAPRPIPSKGESGTLR